MFPARSCFQAEGNALEASRQTVGEWSQHLSFDASARRAVGVLFL